MNQEERAIFVAMDEVKFEPAQRATEPAAMPSSGQADEPFECPNCGQMLAPTCRVCVACYQPVDPAKAAKKAPPLVATISPIQASPTAPGRMQFSWRIFLVVLGIYIGIVVASESFLSAPNYEALLTGVLLGTSLWVLYDAHSKRVPHPFRWGISSLLLWIVVFPWYLSRRREPESPCPLMEAQASVFLRALLGIIVIFILLSIVAALVTHKLPHQ